MQTFEQIFLETLNSAKPKVVFHETPIKSAIAILKSGKIKGKFVDDPKAKKSVYNDELGEDYGHVVYTSSMNGRLDYCGVHDPDVMFVIDTSSLEGQYEPTVEGGLYTVKQQIDLSNVIHVHISDDGDVTDRWVLAVWNMARQRQIPVTTYATKTREQVIAKFRQ